MLVLSNCVTDWVKKNGTRIILEGNIDFVSSCSNRAMGESESYIGSDGKRFHENEESGVERTREGKNGWLRCMFLSRASLYITSTFGSIYLLLYVMVLSLAFLDRSIPWDVGNRKGKRRRGSRELFQKYFPRNSLLSFIPVDSQSISTDLTFQYRFSNCNTSLRATLRQSQGVRGGDSTARIITNINVWTKFCSFLHGSWLRTLETTYFHSL